MAGLFDPGTGQINVIIGADRSFDEMYWCSGVRRRLRDEFGSDSSIPSMVALVVEKVDRLEDVYDNLVVNEGEIDLIEML